MLVIEKTKRTGHWFCVSVREGAKGRSLLLHFPEGSDQAPYEIDGETDLHSLASMVAAWGSLIVPDVEKQAAQSERAETLAEIDLTLNFFGQVSGATRETKVLKVLRENIQARQGESA